MSVTSAARAEGSTTAPWSRDRRLTAALTVLVLSTGAIACTAATDRPTEPRREGYTQKGKASWYGPQFDGRDTASGERFDMNRPSAAHRTLPFGTVVRVENLDNGRTTQVRINDRGPFVRGRILDLSRAAAEELDMVVAGVANIRLRVVAWPDEPATAARSGRPPPRQKGRRAVTLQAGAFRERERAERLAERLRRYDRRARVFSADGWYRVQVRGLTSSEAARLRKRLSGEGLDTVVLND